MGLFVSEADVTIEKGTKERKTVLKYNVHREQWRSNKAFGQSWLSRGGEPRETERETWAMGSHWTESQENVEFSTDCIGNSVGLYIYKTKAG